MTQRHGLLGALLMAASIGATAAPADSLMIIATPEGTQTTTSGTTTYYTRLLEVSLTNVGQQPISLAQGCFKAFDRLGRSYALDIVDEDLLKGTLKPGQHKKGDMGFSSPKSDVYEADIVRPSTDCPH